MQGCATRAGKASTRAITVPSRVWADINNRMRHYFSLWSCAAPCPWVNLFAGGCCWILLENLPCAVSFPPSGAPSFGNPELQAPGSAPCAQKALGPSGRHTAQSSPNIRVSLHCECGITCWVIAAPAPPRPHHRPPTAPPGRYLSPQRGHRPCWGHSACTCDQKLCSVFEDMPTF